MSPVRVAAIRAERNGPLVLATIPPHLKLIRGEPVLAEIGAGTILARVDLVADQILFAPPSAPRARIVAAGADSPEVVAALGQNNAAALAMLRDVCGENVPIRDAAWSADGARLTLTFQGSPPPGVAELRDRLASIFMTEIRFDWPGGTETPLPG